jgi:hypothetical protein
MKPLVDTMNAKMKRQTKRQKQGNADGETQGRITNEE